MNNTQEIVLKAVNAVVLRLQKEHRVPECASRIEVEKQINEYFSGNKSEMPSRQETDSALQWLVANGYLKETPAINEMTYYVLKQNNKLIDYRS